MVIIAHYNPKGLWVLRRLPRGVFSTKKNVSMTKSCIKIKPITGSSEKHNTREIEPKYLIQGQVPNIHIVDSKIKDVRNEIEKKYFETVGQKMQAKSTPIREAVILLPDDDNDKNLENLFALNDQLKERYGIQAFQVHIHNDEGHIDKDGKAKYNYHAHVVYNWTDKNTGKSLKLSKEDLSDIQTLTAECLQMERGLKGSKSLSLDHHQYRGYLEIKDKFVNEFKIELTEKKDRELRTQIIENERQNKDIGRSTRGVSR